MIMLRCLFYAYTNKIRTYLATNVTLYSDQSLVQ